MPKAQLLLVGFLSEHHTTLKNAHHSIYKFKKAFLDSQVLQYFAIKQAKMSYIFQDTFGFYESSNLIKMCQSQKFSKNFHESTDVSIIKVPAIIVQFFEKTVGEVCDYLLDTIEIEKTPHKVYTAA